MISDECSLADGYVVKKKGHSESQKVQTVH